MLRFDGIRDLQVEAVPYSNGSHKAGAYLLMVASIHQGAPAEHTRDLIARLHRRLGNELFSLHRLPPERYARVLEQYALPTWEIGDELTVRLCAASRFASEVRRSQGFIEWAKQFRSTTEVVRHIEAAFRCGREKPEVARSKAWTFMRWMVRRAPDLGLWNPAFRQDELRVALDTHTGRAFSDFCTKTAIGEHMRDKGVAFSKNETGRITATPANVETATQVARWLFPDDPARVHYAFFCYGRRFQPGEEAHRCWKIVGCSNCPIRDLVGCPGKN